MRYNVAQLIKGPTGASRSYEFCEDIGNLDAGLEPICPLEGQITLLRTSQGILVTGKLHTTLRAECQRCLELYDTEVEIDLEEEFLPLVAIGDAPVDPVPEVELDGALLIGGDHILDLREVIRQDLWLALPMEGICRPDCAGLCPQCGGNRNLGECHCETQEIDPRWSVLQALLSEEPDSHERSD